MVVHGTGRNADHYFSTAVAAAFLGTLDDTEVMSRPVTYLLGGLDTLPLFGFDGSCPAMAQGSSRLTRGEAFFKLVTEKHGARHKEIVIPTCGHNDRCMFTTEVALPVLFGKP